jgi:hypothetical protein
MAISEKKILGFLDLPTELRLKIYNNLFRNGTAHFKFGIRGSSVKGCIPLSSQLLRTCQTCHREGRDILYSMNSFRFEHYEDANFFISEFSIQARQKIKHFFFPQILPVCGVRKNNYELKDFTRTFRDLRDLQTACLWVSGIESIPAEVCIDSGFVEGDSVRKAVWNYMGRPKDGIFQAFNVVDVEVGGQVITRSRLMTWRLIIDLQQLGPFSTSKEVCHLQTLTLTNLALLFHAKLVLVLYVQMLLSSHPKR